MGGANKAENDALQSGEGDLARGQDEREFGAGGQDVQSTGAREDRDVNRDGKLDSAGADASARAPLGSTPMPPD
ncbi:hypothetical protein [Sphingomonas lenta]|uniref:Uncharacterized protein n=1 Tax=Sphingomonas lenta TaxID=1141887 RepID=A0A2A2SHJ8_9SPHN|nr:hypothetical protein [Sphingomonas lenta]PAX08719.1 hypothetical protein CKY28_04980 [Sphingomonas lenta]